MRKRCLPTRLIFRNICLMLALVASSVVIGSDIHASANAQGQRTEALRKLFVYQILLAAEQQQ